MVSLLIGLSIPLSAAMTGRLSAEDALPVAAIDRDGPVDFEKEILPLLRRNCMACHNASEAQSDLVLETPEAILKGGIEGPGVVPGNADESLVFQLAAHRRDSFMPPEDNDVGAKNLTPEELGLIKLWIDQGAKGEVASGGEAIAWQSLPSAFNPIYAVAVSPYGRFVAAGRANQIFMYSVPSQQELGRLTDTELLEAGVYERPGVAHRDLVQSLAFSPDGAHVASGGFGNVKIWRREIDGPQAAFPSAEGDVRDLTVSSDHRFAAVAYSGGTIKVYDVTSDKLLHTLDGLPEVTCLALNADGSRLVGGLRDQTVRRWNLSDGKEITRLETPTAVTAVAISSDGNHIITGEADHAIRIWATPDGDSPAPQPEEPGSKEPQPTHELKGHGAEITALTPVPDQPTQFVSASLDGTARHWDAAAGKEIRSLNHGGPIRSVAVRADGQRIATGSETGAAKLWNTQDGKQLTELTSDSQRQDELDNIQLAIELAKLHMRNAESDWEAATKRQQAETENADKAAVDLVRTEFELKEKTEAATEAIAKQEAAEEELTALEMQRAEAEAAYEKADDEAKQQAEQELNELTKQFEVAQKEVAKLTPATQKSVEEKQNAEGAVEAAERAIERAKEAVTRVAAELPDFEKLRDEREQDQQTAEDRLARFQQEATSRNALIRDLENAKAAADRAARDVQNRLLPAMEARDAARNAVAEASEKVHAAQSAGTQPDAAEKNALDQALGQLRNADNALGGARAVADAASTRLAELEQQLGEAKTAVDIADDDGTKDAQAALVEQLATEQAEAAKRAAEATEQANATMAEQSAAAETFADASSALDAAMVAAGQTANEAQDLVKAATETKTAADRTATEVEKQNKAATTAKEAADAALVAAQEKRQQAEDDAAKAIAQVEIDNATRKQAAAEQKAAETSAALEGATEAKTAAEAALADAKDESQRIQNVANETLAEARNAFNEAQNELAQADAAAGGLEAQAASAAKRKAAANAALAEVRTPVRAVAFSNDGAQLAVVARQGQVQVCSSETGEPLHQRTAPASTFVAAAYVSGDRLLTADADRSLLTWASLPQWTLEHKIGSDGSNSQLTNRVTALDFNPSGEWLATGSGAPSRSGELNLWNVETGQLLRAIPEAHSDTVLGVRFSPDGKYLASCGADRFMRVFDVETGDLVKSFEGHTHHVLGVDWRADGRMLVTSGADNVIKVWEFATGEQARTITGFDKEITAIEFLGASDNFVIGTGNQQVMTRNTGGGGGPNFAGATDYVYDVDASRDGKTVVAGGQDSVVHIWDQQGKSIVTFAPPSTEEVQPDTADRAAVE